MHLGEASIDHVTPETYKQAAHVARKSRSKRLGMTTIGKDENVVISRPISKGIVGKVKSLGVAARAQINDANLPKRKREHKGGRIETPKVKKFAKKADVLTHELLHIKDPGVHRDYSPGLKGYFKDRSEQHAYSAVAGTLGVRALKKAGVSKAKAREGLRSGMPAAMGAVDTIKRHAKIPKGKSHPSVLGAIKTAFQQRKKIASLGRAMHGDLYIQFRAGGGQAGRKMAKEMYKGIERTYGTSKKVFKSSKIKMSRPEFKPKLPEGWKSAYTLREGYTQTVGRGNRYAGRDRLSSNNAGDSPPSATSPTSRTPAHRPQQQGRVVRKPTNVSEVYSLDHGINESALAKAGGKMNAAAADGTINGVNPASSTPVISNSVVSKVAAGGGRGGGTLSGGFGTSGKGSSRFMGSNKMGGASVPSSGKQTFGNRASAMSAQQAASRPTPSSRSGAQRFRFNPATSKPSFGRNQSMMRNQPRMRPSARMSGGMGMRGGSYGGGGYRPSGSVTTTGYSQRRGWNIGAGVSGGSGGWRGGVSGGMSGGSNRWGSTTTYR